MSSAQVAIPFRYNESVEVIGRGRIDRFGRKHPESRSSLRNWITVVSAATWKNFSELRATFPSADYVKPFVVFNAGGNKYRIIAEILYSENLVRISEVLSHSEYGREGWKK